MNTSGEDDPKLNEILESNTRENTGTNEQWDPKSEKNQTIELPSNRLKTNSVKLACFQVEFKLSSVELAYFQQVEDKLCGVSLLPG